MTIAIVTHKIVKGDGQGRVNYEVVRTALDRGHKLWLIASEIEDTLESHAAVTWIHIPVEFYPTELLRNQVFAWKSHRWLRHNRDKIDCVLANGCITWSAADVNAVHFVHSAWLQYFSRSTGKKKSVQTWYQWIYTMVNAIWERWAFHQATSIVAVSGQVRDELVSIGVPKQKISIIPNGVDPEEFSPGHATRSSFNLPSDPPLALFVGDIKRRLKNLETVLRAMVNLPSLHLAVAGPVENSPYPAMVEGLDLCTRVHFLGYRRNISELMRTADVFVLPSRYESFSLVLLEAMASGLPVITSSKVGASYLVTPECGTVLDRPDDVHGLQSALCRLIQNPRVRSEMGNAARVIAEQHSFSSMAKHYLKLIEQQATSTP